MRVLKIITLPITTSPRYTSYYRYIKSSDLNIKIRATKATEATKVTKAINSLSIPIKLGLVRGFSSLFFIIDISTLSRYLD